MHVVAAGQSADGTQPDAQSAGRRRAVAEERADVTHSGSVVQGEAALVDELLRYDTECQVIIPPLTSESMNIIKNSSVALTIGLVALRHAGADLLHGLPAVADWLTEVEGPLVLGNYVYADGATNVRVSTAVDALSVELMTRRPDVALAFLATPTDVFAVPAEAVVEHRARPLNVGKPQSLAAGHQLATLSRSELPSGSVQTRTSASGRMIVRR